MRWVYGAAVVSGLSSALLVLTVGRHESRALPLDAAFIAAAPSTVAALLLGLGARSSRPRLACFGAGLLVLPCLLGGAFAMFVCPANDDKWTCVWAGVVSAAAGIIGAVAAGRLAFPRAKA
jgi:hypothetical protein